MTTTYRIDYIVDGAINITVLSCRTRREAMTRARRASRREEIGMAYAIASVDGRDTGQRVYANGNFSYQDDAF